MMHWKDRKYAFLMGTKRVVRIIASASSESKIVTN